METVKILVLTANPRNTKALRLGEEVREIEAELERSTHRSCFQLVSKWAVRVDDLARALLEQRPHIVQFSGHGTGEEGLALENEAGDLHLVSTEALSRLFKQTRDTVKCVFLNACFSQVQAEAVHRHIDCVVGMRKAVGDDTAVRFAAKFYQALAAGKSFPGACEFAATVLDLAGSHESTTPVILTRHEQDDPFGLYQTVPSTSPVEVSSLASPPNQSQTVGNITVSGNSHAVSNIQAGSSVTIDQRQKHSQKDNTELAQALAAVAQLKQDLATTGALNSVEKATVEVPVSLLEQELQKPQPDQGRVGQAVAAMQKALDGVVSLAGSVAQVTTLIAKAGLYLP